MEAGIVIKIAMVGIIVAVLSQVLSRAGRDDYALITVLAGIAAVLIMLLPYLSQPVSYTHLTLPTNSRV